MSGGVRLVALALAALVATGPLASAFALEDSDPGSRGDVAAALAVQPPWSLRQPAEGTVLFRGVVNLDAAGTGTAQLMYPAPNAAGLLAAVITHGLLVDSARRSQKDKLQETADRVLAPYQPILEKLSYRELMLGALARITAPGSRRLAEPAEAPLTEVWVESAPVFAITQDQNAIILDNAIIIHAPRGSYRNTVRVVSSPRKEADPGTAWMADGGRMLKEESERLLAASVDLAMEDARQGGDSPTRPYKTIRYWEGGEEKMERGQVIDTRCDHVVLRNLRGELMAVPPHPVATTAPAASCAASSR